MPDLPLSLLSRHHDLLCIPYRSEMVSKIQLRIFTKSSLTACFACNKSCESTISIQGGQWHLISRLAVMPFSITLLRYTNNIYSTGVFPAYRHPHELRS